MSVTAVRWFGTGNLACHVMATRQYGSTSPVRSLTPMSRVGAPTVNPPRVSRRGALTPSGHTAVITADGRYCLKHGKHPLEVQRERERLAGDARQVALAPDGGAELIARSRSASGRVTVSHPAPRTRDRWRAALYDAVHHGHVPEGHQLR
jgi:hypothetical protein